MKSNSEDPGAKTVFLTSALMVCSWSNTLTKPEIWPQSSSLGPACLFAQSKSPPQGAAPSAPKGAGPGMEIRREFPYPGKLGLTFPALELHSQVAAPGGAQVSKVGPICYHLACLQPLALGWEASAPQREQEQ